MATITTAVVGALDRAQAARGKPYAIIARTEKGHGMQVSGGPGQLARQATLSRANSRRHWPKSGRTRGRQR